MFVVFFLSFPFVSKIRECHDGLMNKDHAYKRHVQKLTSGQDTIFRT